MRLTVRLKITALFAVLFTLLAAVLAWRFTRQRASIAVRLAAVAPVAIFAVIRYVLMIDSLRSITR